jgi:hypothetical protein
LRHCHRAKRRHGLPQKGKQNSEDNRATRHMRILGSVAWTSLHCLCSQHDAQCSCGPVNW